MAARKKKPAPVPTAPEMKIVLTPLEELQRWPKNPKLHDWDTLGASIKRFGFVQPLTVDEGTGRLVAGHGRLDMLAKMKEAGEDPPPRVLVRDDGAWMVPVIRGIRFESEREAQDYLLVDNRAVERGGWDEGLLAAMLQETSKVDDGLRSVGFTEKELKKLLEAVAEEAPIIRDATPPEMLKGYLANDVRRMMLYFQGDVYERVVAKLEAIMHANPQLEDHTDVFNFLLAHYEATDGTDPDHQVSKRRGLAPAS
jgi:hypothetical protein